MRYIVLSPVAGGFSWWTIADTKSEIMPNFGLIVIYKDAPNAEKEIRALCARMNFYVDPS